MSNSIYAASLEEISQAYAKNVQLQRPSIEEEVGPDSPKQRLVRPFAHSCSKWITFQTFAIFVLAFSVKFARTTSMHRCKATNADAQGNDARESLPQTSAHLRACVPASLLRNVQLYDVSGDQSKHLPLINYTR